MILRQKNNHRALSHLLLAVSVILTAGCQSQNQQTNRREKSGTVFILLDASASVSNKTRTEYARYVADSVVARFLPGERILLSPVGDKTTIYEPVRFVDFTLPELPTQPGTSWNENRAREARACLLAFDDHQRKFDLKHAELKQDLARAFSQIQATRNTYLLDGFEMAGATLAELPAPHTLILLSDGMEDSAEGPSLRFDQISFWKRNRIPTLLEDLKQEKRMPHLTGTEVYIVGASGSSPQVVRNVHAFWTAYLQASGVTNASIHYGARPSFRPNAIDTAHMDQKKYCYGN